MIIDLFAMIKIKLVSFQKHKNSHIEEIEKEYSKRLSRFAKVELISVKNWSEDKGLSEKICKNAHVVGLYIEGPQYTSPMFANHLKELINLGNSKFVFIVGSAEGIPRGVESQLDEKWSISKLTFSHQLMRMLLLEALYRSFDILNGSRYHK